jgi:hypothetical protein
MKISPVYANWQYHANDLRIRAWFAGVKRFPQDPDTTGDCRDENPHWRPAPNVVPH